MKNSEVGFVIVRMVLGLIFFVHGLDKFQSGIGNIAGWFESIGLPGFLAYVIALIELVGGLAMILGIGTRIVAILFAVVMIGAIFKVKLSAGFIGDGSMAGYEFDLILLAASIQFMISRSQFFSLDKWLIHSSKQKIQG